MQIRERPDLHRTISENIKRRFIYYTEHPEKLATGGGLLFLELLRNEYPKAYEKLLTYVPKGQDVG
jgi:hypothetical protein